MPIDKLSDAWLFQRHSQATLRRWVQRLRYFYFIRAWGGHANDGDEFQARIGYADRDDLLTKLAGLGIQPHALPPDFPRPVVGQAYASDEFAAFKNEIRQFPDLEQPGHTGLFGHPAFVWVADNAIKISVAGTRDGNRYEVSEDDFQACLALEARFEAFGWQPAADRSAEQSICCISRANYPELY